MERSGAHPGQCSMDAAPLEVEDPEEAHPEASKARHGASTVHLLATAAYVAIALGHAQVLATHWTSTAAGGSFFASLAVTEVALGFEALVYGLGGLLDLGLGKLTRKALLRVLELTGRVRLLGAAAAWPWLVPWAAELSCRSGSVSAKNGATMVQHGTCVAGVIGGWLLLRELAYVVRGEPPSALDTSKQAQLGDCLPRNAVLGGHFRLDKEDLEATGRAVFVPARAREGLYAGSGLAMLSHLFGSTLLAHHAVGGAVPFWLAGTLGALFCRQVGGRQGSRSGKSGGDGGLWRDAARLLTRFGELAWIWCCVAELQAREAEATWLMACTFVP